MKKIDIKRRILNRDLKSGQISAYEQTFFAVLNSSGSSDVLIELKADYNREDEKWKINKSEVYSERATIVAF